MRITEWMRAARVDPGLILPQWDEAQQCWERHPHQLKGLHAVDKNGDPLAPVNMEGRSEADMTATNAAPWFGRGHDHDALGQHAAGQPTAPGTGADLASMNNEAVLALGAAQLVKLKHADIKAMIRARTLQYGRLTELGEPGETVGGSRPRSVEILLEIIEQMGISPGDEPPQQQAGRLTRNFVCNNSERGCNFHGAFSAVQAHERDCKFAPLEGEEEV